MVLLFGWVILVAKFMQIYNFGHLRANVVAFWTKIEGCCKIVGNNVIGFS